MAKMADLEFINSPKLISRKRVTEIHEISTLWDFYNEILALLPFLSNFLNNQER